MLKSVSTFSLLSLMLMLSAFSYCPTGIAESESSAKSKDQSESSKKEEGSNGNHQTFTENTDPTDPPVEDKETPIIPPSGGNTDQPVQKADWDNDKFPATVIETNEGDDTEEMEDKQIVNNDPKTETDEAGNSATDKDHEPENNGIGNTTDSGNNQAKNDNGGEENTVRTSDASNDTSENVVEREGNQIDETAADKSDALSVCSKKSGSSKHSYNTGRATLLQRGIQKIKKRFFKNS